MKQESLAFRRERFNILFEYMFENVELIDLTHVLSSQTPTWNGSCGFHLETKQDYDQMFRVQQIKMHAGVGTHMDAPSHCILAGKSIHEIPIEQLIVPACVIDVSAYADADYEVSVQDVKAYEAKWGSIPKNALVIAYTGWSRFWSDADAYRNADADGQMHFPAFSKGAVELLLQRDIAGIGIDTLSPDCSNSAFPVHHLILGAGKYIIENMAACDRMPSRGGYVIALPLKVEDATEAPARIIGMVPG